METTNDNPSTFRFLNRQGEEMSANQAYREYLYNTADIRKKSFKEWIEWKKGGFSEATGNETPQPPIEEKKDIKPAAEKFLGMPRPLGIGVAIVGSIAIISGIIYLIANASDKKAA